MKMRRYRVFLLCTVGLCVISFLHYYKALYYVSLFRELSAPYPHIKSFIMVSGFFWKEQPYSLSSVVPREVKPWNMKPSDVDTLRGQRSLEMQVDEHLGVLPQPRAERPERRVEDAIQKMQIIEGQKHIDSKSWDTIRPDEVAKVKKNDPPELALPDRTWPFEDLHRRTIHLQDDTTPYFVRTKAGALCFRQGTEVAAPRDDLGKGSKPVARMHRTLQHQVQEDLAHTKARWGKRLVKCVCRQGWHGPYCGVPTMVYHSNLPTKERLTPREVPRRIINAININHEFDLLHVRFHELAQAVDVFLVCESNFTAYGDERRLQFLHLLLNGTYDYVRHKILYIFLDHFPEGGRQDGWIADDYLRTFLTRNGMSRVRGLRPDDVFIINDADEIPAQEGVLFLKLFDGWTEPFTIHMRKSLYGFFWKQPGSLEIVSGCTVAMLSAVYDGDGIKLRRREYYTMPGFRKYENDTGHILVQWSIGSPVHFAGWHCSWCFTPEGILFKLVSAQNGDFPRWGDYEDKRDLNYIRELIRTGGWFDGTIQEYPPSDPKEPMYAPKYLLENYDRYHYMLENPYARKERQRE